MVRNLCIGFTLLTIFVDAASMKAQDKPNKIPDGLQAMLEKAEHFELLSLSSKRDKSKDAFRGWEMLGKTVVKNEKAKNELVAAFKKGVADNKDGPAFCFIPRHGIRVVQGGKTADFIICFECFQVQAYVGDRLEAAIWVTGSPQTVFDKVLKEAKIPLPKKTGK